LKPLKYKLTPWEHQKEAIIFGRDKIEIAYFMDMGTGKTGATINSLRERYAAHKRILKTLIICPVQVCAGWGREFKAHAPPNVSDKAYVLVGSAKERLAIAATALVENNYCIFITSFEALVRDDLLNFFKKWEPEICIADESHRLKNPKAKTTLAATSLADMASYKYALTGTPMPNSLQDIYAQFRFLDRGETFGTNFFKFRTKYFYDKNLGMPGDKHFPNWQPKKDTEAIFNELIYQKAFRVMKSECMDLPPFVRIRHEVKLGKEQAKAYKEMHRDFVTIIDDDACVADLAITKSIRLQQILSGHAKLDDSGEIHVFKGNPRLNAVADIVGDLPPGAKVVVWACFKENYIGIEAALKKIKVKCVQLVGGMSKTQRNQSLYSFMNNATVRCMIANPASAGTGVDGMQVANYAIYYSRSFNLEYDLQSNDRIYRGGSEIHDKVTRIDLVAPDTLDEAILESLDNKLKASEAVLAWRKKFGKVKKK